MLCVRRRGAGPGWGRFVCRSTLRRPSFRRAGRPAGRASTNWQAAATPAALPARGPRPAVVAACATATAGATTQSPLYCAPKSALPLLRLHTSKSFAAACRSSSSGVSGTGDRSGSAPPSAAGAPLLGSCCCCASGTAIPLLSSAAAAQRTGGSNAARPAKGTQRVQCHLGSGGGGSGGERSRSRGWLPKAPQPCSPASASLQAVAQPSGAAHRLPHPRAGLVCSLPALPAPDTVA